MNSRLNLAASPHYSLGLTLAETVLYLRRQDALDFAEQFASLAARPVAVQFVGNGEIFRQAVCFPATGSGLDDFIQPVAGFSPYAMVELLSGHVTCLRLADCTSGRFSLSAFLRGIERNLESVRQEASDCWHSIQRSIEVRTKRRVVLVDFVLEANEIVFWRDIFPSGGSKLMADIFRCMPPTPALGRKQAVAALLDIQSNHYRTAVDDFIDGLDGDVIQAIRASGLSPSAATYNTYRRGDVQASNYRIQAAGAIPLLGYLLGEENHRAARLRRLVDSGQPLWPALADAVGVPVETVRWLRGKTVDDVSEAWLGRIPELMKSLAHLLPEKRPKNRDEWTAYTDFALVLDRPHTAPRHARWLQDISRLGWIAAREKFAAMGAAPSDLLEIADLLHEIIGAVGGELLPHIARQWRTARESHPEWQQLTETIEPLFLETSVLKQMRASLRWHELQLLPPIEEDAQAEEATPKETAARLDKWPAPLSAPLKLGGLYAHFLTTTAQLRDEGLRMEHCVGSYDHRCLFDGANIVSLRKGDGRSVSTAELRLIGSDKRLYFEVVQHKAHHNGSPSTESAQTMVRLLSELNTDDMQPRLLEMREQLKQRQAMDDTRHLWQADTPNSPQRLRCLKAALKLHVGYGRFLEVARNAIGV